ncbi:nucleotidyltransferase family protein [Agromyces aurantiacus]|uniref:Nucleotidyltransferase family protein n=1 Tax=Agromyces aurantiacus TaxID=165814 RepID=A0ABV9R5K4_9MICO|nr:nucleotidyltransferase domain-containing protein [Agromyces aurantiacus]MBM7505916.1 putative nucleotidyltransferase/putative transcriptional regulator [Agromyces aurantiacus]
MSTFTPIKIDPAIDQLVGDAAHLLGRTKKDIVAAAIREFIETHRAELSAGVNATADRLARPHAEPRRTGIGPLRARLNSNREELVAALAALGASNIRVFGSVARGDESASSDIDLLVDLADDVGLFGLGTMRSTAERILDAPVDIVPASSLKADVADTVLREARPV